MAMRFIFFTLVSLLLTSCKKEVDPKAYNRDASVQLIMEKIAEQNNKIIAANKRVEDSYAEVKKAQDTLENITTKRARYFSNLNLLEFEHQKLLWLEYRLVSLKKAAQRNYLFAELSGLNKNNPSHWVDLKQKELLAESLQEKVKKK